MKHLKLLNYCKRMIKSTSAFGNARASEGFAAHEVAQTDKTVKDQVVKAGLILALGTLVWTSGGVVRQVHAEAWGEGVCRAGWYVDDYYGCVSADGACHYNPNGASNPDCSISSGNTNNSNGGFDVPKRQTPSSYGAVAWDIKKILIGTATNQASKQDAISVAMQKCGKASCKVTTWYANQCVAVGDGDALSKKAIYWYTALGLTQEKAEQNLLAICSKNAKNCRVAFSECSLP